jgi:hypothetical protein
MKNRRVDGLTSILLNCCFYFTWSLKQSFNWLHTYLKHSGHTSYPFKFLSSSDSHSGYSITVDVAAHAQNLPRCYRTVGWLNELIFAFCLCFHLPDSLFSVSVHSHRYASLSILFRPAPCLTLRILSLCTSLSYFLSVFLFSVSSLFLVVHLALSSQLQLGLPSALFPSDFQPKFCTYSSTPPAIYMPHPSHPPWFDHPNTIWSKAQIMQLLKSPVTSSLFSQNIDLSTPFTNTPNLCLPRFERSGSTPK